MFDRDNLLIDLERERLRLARRRGGDALSGCRAVQATERRMAETRAYTAEGRALKADVAQAYLPPAANQDHGQRLMQSLINDVLAAAM